MRRDTTLVQINQSRIAAAPIPTNRIMRPIVVGQAESARGARQRARTRTFTLRGIVPPAGVEQHPQALGLAPLLEPDQPAHGPGQGHGFDHSRWSVYATRGR
jgi:hypothetical protein